VEEGGAASGRDVCCGFRPRPPIRAGVCGEAPILRGASGTRRAPNSPKTINLPPSRLRTPRPPPPPPPDPPSPPAATTPHLRPQVRGVLSRTSAVKDVCGDGRGVGNRPGDGRRRHRRPHSPNRRRRPSGGAAAQVRPHERMRRQASVWRRHLQPELSSPGLPQRHRLGRGLGRRPLRSGRRRWPRRRPQWRFLDGRRSRFMFSSFLVARSACRARSPTMAGQVAGFLQSDMVGKPWPAEGEGGQFRLSSLHSRGTCLGARRGCGWAGQAGPVAFAREASSWASRLCAHRALAGWPMACQRRPCRVAKASLVGGSCCG
jgi:hypothetical protein